MSQIPCPDRPRLVLRSRPCAALRFVILLACAVDSQLTQSPHITGRVYILEGEYLFFTFMDNIVVPSPLLLLRTSVVPICSCGHCDFRIKDGPFEPHAAAVLDASLSVAVLGEQHVAARTIAGWYRRLRFRRDCLPRLRLLGRQMLENKWRTIMMVLKPRDTLVRQRLERQVDFVLSYLPYFLGIQSGSRSARTHRLFSRACVCVCACVSHVCVGSDGSFPACAFCSAGRVATREGCAPLQRGRKQAAVCRRDGAIAFGCLSADHVLRSRHNRLGVC